jgi:hypothetical protein
MLLLYSSTGDSGGEGPDFVHAGTHPEVFLWGVGGRADPEATYNLCLILKIVTKVML